MRMIVICVAAILAMFQGIASAQEPVASKEESKAAWKQYFDCLTSKASMLDDGLSDARTVASIVAPQCQGALELTIATETRGYGESTKLAIREGFEKGHIDSATQIVLLVRTERRLKDSRSIEAPSDNAPIKRP